MKTLKKSMCGIGVAALMAVCATGARAADTTGPSATDSGIQEIVVTARKREETLSSIPGTVTAISGSALTDTGVQSLDQIAGMTTGVNFVLVGAQAPIIGIRGNVNRTGIPGGSDVPVSVFTDGVYIPRNTQVAYEPLDVQRVEILKGPQGTIYGRNTIGGAINVVTAEPTEQFQGMVTAGGGWGDSFGDYLWNVGGVVSGAIIPDKLLVRVAVEHAYRLGYEESQPFGYRGNNDNETLVRAKATLKITDGLTAKFTVERGRKDADFINQIAFATGRVDTANPTIPQSQLQFSNNIYQAFTERRPSGWTEYTRGTGDLVWDTAIGTFNAISSYADNSSRDIRDVDGSSLPITYTDNPIHTHDFSQELRLTGGAQRFTWLGGLFYFHEFGFNGQSTNFLARSALPGLVQNRISEIGTTSDAGFGQVGYDITDALNFAVGLRYSHDHKDTPFTFLTNGVTTFVRPRDGSWDKFDQNATLKYKWTDRIMTYASYASGFRAGGFNDPTAPTIATISYAPETVHAFELGTKDAFFNDRFVVDLAFYYNQYKNLQINGAAADPNTPGGFIFATTNAGSSNVKGLDLDMSQRLTPELTIHEGWSYVDGKIDSYIVPPGTTLPNPTGLQLPRAPRNTALFGVDYVHALGDGKLKLGGQYMYTSGYPTELEPRLDPTGQIADARLSSRKIVNTQIGYDWRQWNVTLSARNLLFDKYYASSRQGAPNQMMFVTPGEPRTILLNVRRDF